MRAHENRRIPIPAKRRFVRAFGGNDVNSFAGFYVVANKFAALKFGVNGVVIFRVNRGTEAIATLGGKPIGVDDSAFAASARGAANAGIILRAAVDVIERSVGVGDDIVKLSERKIFRVAPCAAAVVTFVEAAVAADHDVLAIVGVNPDDVIIHVFALRVQPADGAAAVIGCLDDEIHHVDAFRIIRIGKNGAVVLGRRAEEIVASFPTDSPKSLEA